MDSVTRILIGIDFSEPSGAAFRRAIALCRLHNAELTILHVVSKVLPFGGPRERLARLAAFRQAAEAMGVRVHVSLQHGDPAGVILRYASPERPDIIVLGTHQRIGFARFRTGSVAETVTLRANQPVLVVPTAAADVHPGSDRVFESIVAAVDFGATSHAVVEQAVELARNPHDRVTLVHVVPGASPAAVAGKSAQQRVPEFQRLLARVAWQQLQEVIPRVMSVSPRLHARVAIGDPCTEIARVAADASADLIVVGVSARGAIGRRIFGTTATRLMRTAAHPLLTVPELTPANDVTPSKRERFRPAA
jgi:nucleotide-binding universal stress UspA family protein